MRQVSSLIIAAFAVLAMAACSPTAQSGNSESDTQSSSSNETADAPQSAPQSAPTPEPSEKVLDKKAAGTLYLDIVCDGNSIVQEYNDRLTKANDTALSGEVPDIAPLKESARKVVDTRRLMVTVLDDTYYVWPESVRDSIKSVRDDSMAEVGGFERIAQVNDWNSLVEITWAEGDGTAPQEIRYQLGLDADTQSSCGGHTGKLSDLASQSEERQSD